MGKVRNSGLRVRAGSRSLVTFAGLLLPRGHMSDVLGDPPPPTEPAERITIGQRFFDNVFLLLALGVLIVFVLYTGWGMWEILTLPKATLP